MLLSLMCVVSSREAFSRVLLTGALAVAGCVVGSVPAWAIEDPTLAELTPEQWQLAYEDNQKFVDVAPAGEVNRGQVITVIQAPIEELAPIVRDYNNIPLWSEALNWANVMSDDGVTQFVEGETNLPWPLANRTWQIEMVTIETTIDGVDVWLNQWTYVPGSGNVDDTNGYWMLYRYPDDPSATVVKYVLNADPGLWLPDFVLNFATERALPQLLDGLRGRHAQLFRGGPAPLRR